MFCSICRGEGFKPILRSLYERELRMEGLGEATFTEAPQKKELSEDLLL
jgi:hypothetical protein